MEFDVVMVDRGLAGLLRGDEVKQLNPELWVVVLEKAPKSARIYCRVPSSIPSASTGCCRAGAKKAEHLFQTGNQRGPFDCIPVRNELVASDASPSAH